MIDVRFRDPWASAVAIEADAARCRIVDQIEPAASRTLPPSDCVGLVLADAGVAAEASPWFDTAAMDGHAMHRLTGRGAAWRVVGRASAGNPFSGEIRPGEAIRIMTGACVSPGASV